MDIHDSSKKAGAKIIAAVDVLSFSPYIVAQMISNAPGPVQRRIWLTVKALIHLWAIDARARLYDPANRDIYLWAERHDDGNDRAG